VSTESPRYIVETGVDGSFLLVNRGADCDQRIAIERFTDASEARDHAATLSSLEEFISRLPRSRDPFWDAAEAAVAGSIAPLNEEHNFNHLLPQTS
jgi:hypothetical protein